jgi:hypothetical protein
MAFNKKNRYRRRSEEKSDKARQSYKLLIVTLALAVFFTAFGFYFFKGKFTGAENKQYATKQEIRQVVDKLNNKLDYLSISIPDDLHRVSLLNENGKSEDSIPTQYVISVQDKYVGKVSIFNAKEYVMNLWSEKHKGNEPLKLCEAIDKTLKADDKIFKAIQDSDVKMSLSVALWGVVNPGVEFKLPEIAQIELAGVLRELLSIKAKKVEVLIKGYADGQSGPWKKNLLAFPHHYNSINVYQPFKPELINWLEYNREESPLSIPETYTNEELPDLRAQFVKHELIESSLRHCEGNTETEVHILKGQSDKTSKIYEPDRKVEIFINLY